MCEGVGPQANGKSKRIWPREQTQVAEHRGLSGYICVCERERECVSRRKWKEREGSRGIWGAKIPQSGLPMAHLALPAKHATGEGQVAEGGVTSQGQVGRQTYR